MIRRFLIKAAAAVVLIAVVLLILFRVQAALRETKLRTEAAPAAGRFVHAEGIDIFVQETGPANGVPVLFIHGTGAWSELWRETLDAVAEDDFRAIAIDLPPFGFSERPSDRSYARRDQAKRILGVLGSLGISRAILVGHSFGGGPTAEAALLAPARMHALVLVDAALGLDAPSEEGGVTAALMGVRPVRNVVLSAAVTNPLMTRTLFSMFVANGAAITDARVAVLQKPLALRGATDALGDWVMDFMGPDRTSVSKDPSAYGRIAFPSLVIWGDRDTTTPLGQGKRLAELIPGAEFVTMKGIGHMPQIEDPAQFNRILLTFLRKLRPS